MKLSYVIVTHNRCEALLRTLRHLYRTTPLPLHQWECWVVDNASTDGTAEALRQQFCRVNVIRREHNEGAGARSHAFPHATGEYMILLDDDSYPIGDTVERSLHYLDATPEAAALCGLVVLPNGSYEACAMPSVLLSGAVCLRKRVVDEIGGFRPEFFRKAGEYDFSFRIWAAGYRVDRFEDVLYRHDKVMTGRSTALAHFMDLRNNLILVERFLPLLMRRVYRHDWLRRYTAIARHAGCSHIVGKALAEARQWARLERLSGRQTLGADALETIFEWRTQQRLVAAWAKEHAVRRVVVADWGKNLYATWRACRKIGLKVKAIGVTGEALVGERYRGAAVEPLERALERRVDGVICANVNPAQIDAHMDQLRRLFPGPRLRLWQPRYLNDTHPIAQSA